MQNNELDQAAVRTWLKQMPDAGVFNDKCWLACDGSTGDWYIYDSEPIKLVYDWDTAFSDGCCDLDSEFFNMPELSGDQWKYSCISVMELAEWQMENAK